MNRLPFQKFSRRQWMAAVPALGMGWLLSQCKASQKKETPSTAPTDPFQLAQKPPTDSTPDSPSKKKGETPKEKPKECSQPKIDLKDFSPISENLTPQIECYGDTKFTSIALGLPKYQHGLLASVILMFLPSGRVVSQRGIFEGSDILPDTSLRPLFFNNLRLKDDTKLAFLFKLRCEDCDGGFEYLQYTLPSPIQFNKSFREKPVFSPLPSAIPPNYALLQLAPQFIPRGTSSDDSQKVITIESNDGLKAFGFDKVVITDVLGRKLFEPGEEFNRFIDMPEFFCYQLIEDRYYVRTYMRVY